MIHFNSHKQLVTKPIRLQDKSVLSTSLNSFFDDPVNYFNNDLNDKKIVFNRKVNQNKYIIFFSKLKPGDIKYLTRETKDKDKVYRTKFLLSKLNNSRSVSTLYTRDKFTVSRETDHNELEKIYSYFNRKRNTTKGQMNFFKDYSHTIQKNVNQALDLQTKTLKNKHKINLTNDLISQHVSKKINKPQEELLMSKTGFYRLKKEVKDDVEKDLKKKDPLPSFKWPSTLRSKDSFSTYYMNTGSLENPKWQLIIERNDKLQEQICYSNMMNKAEMKEMKSFLDNSYLHKRVGVSAYNKVRTNINNKKIMKAITIQGKDLLKIEKEITNSLKGKKYLIQSENDPDKLNPVLYEKKAQYMKLIHEEKDQPFE